MENTVADASEKKVIDGSPVVESDSTSHDFFQRFNRNVKTGIIYSKGNQSTQYTFGLQVIYPRERRPAGDNFNSTLSSNV